MQNDKYDRMNPDWKSLVMELNNYARVDYGAATYSLSTAEAKLLLEYILYTQPFLKYEGSHGDGNG